MLARQRRAVGAGWPEVDAWNGLVLYLPAGAGTLDLPVGAGTLDMPTKGSSLDLLEGAGTG